MLAEHGWSGRSCVPHGGHQLSLNMAAGLGLGGNESYPGVFQPFGGFADDLVVAGGHGALPDAPGLGVGGKANLYALMRTGGGEGAAGGDRRGGPGPGGGGRRATGGWR